MRTKSPAQRAAHNAKMRRYYARRALREGKAVRPLKDTAFLPAGADMSLIEENKLAPPNETPHERKKRKWRKRYGDQALSMNGRYQPRISKVAGKNMLDEEVVKERKQNLVRQLNKGR